jgi:hypothetical protein
MKTRVFSVFALTVGLPLLLILVLAVAVQAAEVKGANQAMSAAVSTSSAADISWGLQDPMSLGCTSAVTFTPAFTTYLPAVFKNPPWITVTARGDQAWGEVGPSSFCNANYKVALYAKTDIWYVQPYTASGRDVQINPDCTWESFTHEWYEIAAHLVLESYYHPDTIGPPAPPCPPLDPAETPSVLAASCYPLDP